MSYNNDNFLNILDSLSKSRVEKKKEEYLKKLKEKKLEKRKNKKKAKTTEGLHVNGSNGVLEKIEENILDDIDGEEIQREERKDNGEIKLKSKYFKININVNSCLGSEKTAEIRGDEDDVQKLLKEENIEIEYIDDITNKSKDFKNVFDYFVIPKREKKESYEEEEEEENYYKLNEMGYGFEEEAGDPDRIIAELHVGQKLSKKKRKLLSRMKVSELKQITNHPEVVEAWDVTAQDPILLVQLKSMKNTVQVPKHWAQKRKFLQNKRGVLKQPFKLPEFVEATGISKIRDNVGVDKKSLKQKMRERMQPKLGKMDIDYQVLHDAFFRHQTKPFLTIQGDIFYENKEYESKMKIYKPGRISEKLRVALGILETSPPPWIINMQRYGPPPSYPNLKIPGVNTPIYDPTADITPNLWTPPVEEDKPVLVYDFSISKSEDQMHWGDLREVEEDEMSEEFNEDVSVSDQGVSRNITENVFSGMDIDLSTEKTVKPGCVPIAETGYSNAVPNPNVNISAPKVNENSFYTVLEQKASNIGKSEIYGSSHAYVISGVSKEEKKKEEEKKEVKEKEPVKKKEIKTPAFKF